MQKGLGIAALVLAIVSIFTPVIGPWITVLSAMMAAFAYGSASSLGVASIVINVVNIIFLSPSIWIHGALVSGGAEMDGQQVVFFPWIVLGAQAIASVALIVFHIKSKSAATGEVKSLRISEAVGTGLTRAPTLEQVETPKRHAAEDISTGLDPKLQSENKLTPPIEPAPSTALSEISSEALAERESIETPRESVLTPRADVAGTRKWALPLGGIIAVSLLGYLGLNLYESKQELDRVRLQKEAQERMAQQEAEARRVAEQQAEYERRARQEAAAREAEAQRKAQGEADARKTAQEQAAAEKRARQEASAREAAALRKAQQEADARRKAQAIEAQQIAREQAGAERKASLEVEAQRKHQDSLSRLEKKYSAAQERAKKQYLRALARANSRADRVARAEEYYQKALAKAQKYYEENRIEVEARYQDALTKAQKAYE